MGQLDDAIREHLELKRRRGADSNEVARQEQEAFGPPRRGDFEAAPETNGSDGLVEHALDEPATFAESEQTALHVVEDPHPVQHEPPRPQGDPADRLPHADEPEPLRDTDPAPQDEPPRPQGDPADRLPHVDQPTRAFDAEEVRAATTPPPVTPPPAGDEPETSQPERPAAASRPEEETEEETEDVLEETPEFLQETPEHDRLWFEQRPPRDFDF
jgi:hypothetical protein